MVAFAVGYFKGERDGRSVQEATWKMKNSPDPAVHQKLEREMMEHVERLLGDERLRIDTTRGAAGDDDVSQRQCGG